MTKVLFDYGEISTRLLNKLEETTDELDKLIKESNSCSIPRGFNATKYRDTIASIKNANKGIKNVRSDLIRANSNYEEAELNCKRRNGSFNSEFRIELDVPIVEIK